MKKYIVRFVDDCDLRFKTFETEAENEEMAVLNVYDIYGHFDHYIANVEEVKQ